MKDSQVHPAGFADRAEIHVPYGTVRHLRRLRPDVIISTEFGIRTLQALEYASWESRVPLIAYAAISERTEMARGRARRLLRTLTLKRVAAVIALGASGARYLEGLSAPREKIFVVPRTTEMRPFLDLPLVRAEGAARRLFFPGQFISRKGLVPFLDVLSRWAVDHPDQQVEFRLLGGGPERSGLEGRPRPPNLTVVFSRGVPYSELPRFYAEAGILAFPTLADEWGLVVNEALASGMPVLGSVHSQAVVELVRDGETGWTFDPDRPEEMYRAVDRALTTSPERVVEMRGAARRSVEGLTPEWAADRVVEVLRFARSQEQCERRAREAWQLFNRQG